MEFLWMYGKGTANLEIFYCDSNAIINIIVKL